MLKRELRKSDELAQKAESAGADLRKRLREAAKRAIRDMDPPEWDALKDSLRVKYSNPSLEAEIFVAERSVRFGVPLTNLDRREAERTRGFAKSLAFKLVEKVVDDPALSAFVQRVGSELDEERKREVKPLSRAQLRRMLARMPNTMRNRIISQIPENWSFDEGVEKDSERDRKLANDLFYHELSDRELADKYSLTVNGIKSAAGNILDELVERPLVRRICGLYGGYEGKVAPMGFDDARRLLRIIPPEERRRLAEEIPKSTWKVRDARPRHIEILCEYFEHDVPVSAFVEDFNRRHPHDGLKGSTAENTIRDMVGRIAGEPALADELRLLAGESRGLTIEAELARLGDGILNPPRKRYSTEVSAPLPAAPVTAVPAGETVLKVEAKPLQPPVAQTVVEPQNVGETVKVATGFVAPAAEAVNVAVAPPSAEDLEWVVAPRRVWVKAAPSAHVQKLLSNMTGDSAAFSKQTGVPLEFLFSLDLEALSQAASENRMRTRMTLATYARIAYSQEGTGGATLSERGFAAAIKELSRSAAGVEEADIGGCKGIFGFDRSGSRSSRGKLTLNKDKIRFVTDHNLFGFARGVVEESIKRVEVKPAVPQVVLSHQAEVRSITSPPVLPQPKPLAAEAKRPLAPAEERPRLPARPNAMGPREFRAPPKPVAPQPQKMPPHEIPKAPEPLPQRPVTVQPAAESKPAPRAAEAKAAAPQGQPPQEAAKVGEETLTEEQFDSMMRVFSLRYVTTADMWSEAGLVVRPSAMKAVFDLEREERLGEDGPAAKRLGREIPVVISYLRRLGAPEREKFIGRLASHLEAQMNRWAGAEPQRKDLPRLAYCRVIASDIAKGEKLINEETELGRRFKRLELDYGEAFGLVPEPLFPAYELVESRFVSLAADIYDKSPSWVEKR